MTVLMLNGSANPKGNTQRALLEIGGELEKEGISYEIFTVGAGPVRDCMGCGGCVDGNCVFEGDGVNDFLAKAREADGFIFASPVYYAHPSGRILSFLDRVFYADSGCFAFKPGAAVAVARRGGTTATLDALGKYFGISRMPTVGSTYWNLAHGSLPGEIEQDAEGLQTLRNLARNMAWLLKSIDAGKKAGLPLPTTERGSVTNFVR